jgi:trans-aconitate 2-methyltransferase
MTWDPTAYLQFGHERGRPFHDLLARVPAGRGDVRRVVDLGCGPGNLTRQLAGRWPGAQVEGIDSSPEMVGRACSEGETDRLTFRVGDVRAWSPAEPVDVMISNATLQWVPGHLDLLERLLAAVRPGGWLAFQVPGNFGERSHTAIAELRAAPRWRERLDGLDVEQPSSEEPTVYLDRLVGLGCRTDVWETTYLQVLQGPDAVVRWISSTGLRPVLGALDKGERGDFLAEYRALVAPAYPERPWGTVLPYRRIFAVAQRAADVAA